MWFRSVFDVLTSRTTRTTGQKYRRRLAERRSNSRRLQLEPLEDRCLLASYILTDLGTLPGGYYSTATDINAAGQVVGTADSPQNVRAVLWNNGTIINLGTLQLDGLNGESQASAINDLGQIVGWSDVKSRLDYPYLEPHAFLITPEDTDGDSTPDRWFRDLDADGVNDLMIDLGVPAGATYSLGIDINNVGQVVAVGNDMASYTAFLWDSGVFTELGAIGADGGGASGINDAGQVVGYAQNAVGYSHPFVWDSNRGTTDLGTIDYPYGRATAINSSGSVVGLGLSSDTMTGITFLWTPDQPNGTVGAMTALDPLLDGSSGTPEDISDSGLVVGTSTHVTSYCEDDGFGEVCWSSYWYRAVVWENGVAAVLQDQVVGQSVNLTSATAINAAGQIVGWGSRGGYLLTPTDSRLISISDVYVAEGDSGPGSAIFTISLDAASDQPVTVTYATANGTATAGSDYVAVSGTVTFAPGETSQTVPVVVNGDTLFEPHESFFINLTSPTNALIVDGSGMGTIQNDDPTPPSLVVSDASVKEGNTGTVSATFTVSLSAAHGQPVTVYFETANSSATAGSDYQAGSGTLTFAPGETSKTIAVLVNGDRLGETNEAFRVILSGATNAQVIDGVGIGTIVDDEPRIRFESYAWITEGNTGVTYLSFNVTLSAATDSEVTVCYATRDYTAMAGSDYEAQSGTLVFAPGETTKTISIAIYGDLINESEEYFHVVLSEPSGNAVIDPDGWGTAWATIRNDDTDTDSGTGKGRGGKKK